MIEAWHLWLIAGFLLAVAEIMVPGFFLLPFGVAGMITAALSLTGMAVVWQLTFFVLGGGLFVFLTR
ncbi:NfeD family protein, partial [bacterium]|nr:NfeD family protein [bacterium]